MKAHPMFLVLAFALVLSGCVAPPTPSVQQVLRKDATFTLPVDRVWPLLVREVGLEYPVRTIEKASGLITTDWVNMPAGFNNMQAANWIVPPGGFLATWNGLRMNMKVMAVESEPGKTRVTVNCHYEAFEDNVQKAWVVAVSNGAIEDKILGKIDQALRTAPAVVAVEGAVAPVGKSPADALIELKKLFDAGAITPVEYEAKKKIALEKL